MEDKQVIAEMLKPDRYSDDLTLLHMPFFPCTRLETFSTDSSRLAKARRYSHSLRPSRVIHTAQVHVMHETCTTPAARCAPSTKNIETCKKPPLFHESSEDGERDTSLAAKVNNTETSNVVSTSAFTSVCPIDAPHSSAPALFDTIPTHLRSPV